MRRRPAQDGPGTARRVERGALNPVSGLQCSGSRRRRAAPAVASRTISTRTGSAESDAEREVRTTMDPMSARCLTDGELQELAFDGEERASAPVQNHVERCPLCRERLSAERRDAALFQELKGVA